MFTLNEKKVKNSERMAWFRSSVIWFTYWSLICMLSVQFARSCELLRKHQCVNQEYIICSMQYRKHQWKQWVKVTRCEDSLWCILFLFGYCSPPEFPSSNYKTNGPWNWKVGPLQAAPRFISNMATIGRNVVKVADSAFCENVTLVFPSLHVDHITSMVEYWLKVLDLSTRTMLSSLYGG